MFDINKEKQIIYYKGIKWEVFIEPYSIALEIRDIRCIEVEFYLKTLKCSVLNKNVLTKDIDISKSINLYELITDTIKQIIEKYYQRFKKIVELYRKHDSYSFAHLIDFSVYIPSDLKMKIKWLEALKPFSDEIFLLTRLNNSPKIMITTFLLWKKFQSIDREEIYKKYRVRVPNYTESNLELKSSGLLHSFQFGSWFHRGSLRYRITTNEGVKVKEIIFKHPRGLIEFFLNLKL